jgi:ribokinase
MIVVFGSINFDLIFAGTALPRPGETVLAADPVMQPGGKGANQALAAARDGAPVVMAGAVGTDSFSTHAITELAAAGVDLRRVRRCEGTTGLAIICTDSAGRNQIIVAPGANLRAEAGQIEDALLDENTLVLIQMECDPAESARLIHRAAARGARTLLNLAPAGSFDCDALAKVDFLIVNEEEAAWLSAEHGIGTDAAALHEALGPTVVRTLGADGAELAGPGLALRQAAPAIDAVDATAAGDCFIGVLAASLDRGHGVKSALARATAAASLCCTRHGSQISLPIAPEIEVAAAEWGISP